MSALEDQERDTPVGAPPPSRRTLLRGVGAGVATVVVGGTGALGYRIYENGALQDGTGAPYEPWSHWRDEPGTEGIVAAAILAANPHNTQPWIFHVAPHRIDVVSDPSRRLDLVDPYVREHHVGLGCALENAVLAAAARGLTAAVTLLPDPTTPTHVARVDLTAGAVDDTALHRAIGDRHSDRGPYTTEPVSSAALASLTSATAGTEGAQSRQAFAWFRGDRAQINEHRDGLTLDGQGFSPVKLALAKIIPASSRSTGDAVWLKQVRTVHTRTAAAYGVITVADPSSPAQRLHGGRLLQRVHLAATVHGLGLHHMNQITERIDQQAQAGGPMTFAPALDALLARPGSHVLSTFRIGHPVRKGLRSPRRSTGAVIR